MRALVPAALPPSTIPKRCRSSWPWAYKVAGFSVNADAGATLKREAIVARLNAVTSGDIIVAHMNKPASETADGLSSGLKSLLARGFHFVTLSEMDVRPAHR